MKKCLICLLAIVLLLLPGISMAQEQHAYQLTMGWEADADGLSELLTAWDQLDQATVPTLAQGLQDLLGSVSVTAGVQDNAGWLSCSLSGEELISLSLHETSDAVYFLFNLLPGYVMTQTLDQQLDVTSAEAYEQLYSEIDWTALESLLLGEFDAWMDSMNVTSAAGSFIGDAYEGGTMRNTFRLDDRDLSLLLDGLALRVEQSLPAEAPGWDDLIAEVRESTHEAALSNAYSYIIHQVLRDDESVAGYSFVVLEEETQVATLSVSGGEPLRLVLGLGYGGCNHYLELTASALPVNEGQQYDLHMALYADKARAGYHAAKLAEDGLLLSADGSVQLLAKDDSYFWNVNLAIQDRTGTPIALRQTMEGSLSLAEPSFHHTSRLLLAETDAPILTETIDVVPSQPQTFDIEGLTSIPMDALEDEEQSALMDEIINDAAVDLALRLFKLIPPQLLTLLY